MFSCSFFSVITHITVKLTVSAEKSLSISVKTFFFFFFGDHLILGGKNVRISDFGPKITLNFGEDIRIFEGLCLKSPPTKFSRSDTGMGPPNQKSWLRLCLWLSESINVGSLQLYIPTAIVVIVTSRASQ